VDFATLSEPANCREYVAVHHMLGAGHGDRLLDVACGAGLAIELASVRGADCAGIDASARLVAVARDRSPRADIRVVNPSPLVMVGPAATAAPLDQRHPTRHSPATPPRRP
jgi:2-polyprenyl-3-methyl-5-hydroxy-6-metoxy-1,4-benzoquinol methylase